MLLCFWLVTSHYEHVLYRYKARHNTGILNRIRSLLLWDVLYCAIPYSTWYDTGHWTKLWGKFLSPFKLALRSAVKQPKGKDTFSIVPNQKVIFRCTGH